METNHKPADEPKSEFQDAFIPSDLDFNPELRNAFVSGYKEGFEDGQNHRAERTENPFGFFVYNRMTGQGKLLMAKPESTPRGFGVIALYR